jgi:hypothetical protein
MKLRVAAWLAAITIAPAFGSTIDVTNERTVLLHSGDALSFELSTSTYATYAPWLHAPANPSRLDFLFVTLGDTPGNFSVALESPLGQIGLPAPLHFMPGFFIGLGYIGPVSTLTGSFDLSPAESDALFGEETAALTFRNQGPDILLGLPPYTLRRDLLATVSGGFLHVGARVESILLDPADPVNPVPEPQSGLLYLAGGAILCLLPVCRNRFSRRASN